MGSEHRAIYDELHDLCGGHEERGCTICRFVDRLVATDAAVAAVEGWGHNWQVRMPGMEPDYPPERRLWRAYQALLRTALSTEEENTHDQP